ncbi:protein of unknown function [Methylorubrum extorquens DM4]|uniref:Uncharacterized protein n=1 Tax=Methylorubrum extorquens (strain DSM 6343 / CIP 106787 / DM4) TaxID=661410 RepID=C7CJQ4_METED|nr:protein of unknown function [Methylorubrum extorquens DM4]
MRIAKHPRLRERASRSGRKRLALHAQRVAGSGMSSAMSVFTDVIRIRGHSAGRLSGPFAAPWRTRHDSIV